MHNQRIFTLKYPFLTFNDGYTSGLWCHPYSFRRAEVQSRSLSCTLAPRARSCVNKQPVFHFKVTKMAIDRLSIIKFVELVSKNLKLNYRTPMEWNWKILNNIYSLFMSKILVYTLTLFWWTNSFLLFWYWILTIEYRNRW